MDWQLRLTHVYCEVCEQYAQHLWMHCERFRNNAVPQFSDEEVMTVYLFGIMRHKRTIQDIYEYTQDHLRDWFPSLPADGGFVQRLNKLSSAFSALLEGLHDQWPTVRGWLPILLLDSMPGVFAKGKRRYKAKVASEVAHCGYCASKDMKYYGVKLHVLGLRQAGTLPARNTWNLLRLAHMTSRFSTRSVPLLGLANSLPIQPTSPTRSNTTWHNKEWTSIPPSKKRL